MRPDLERLDTVLSEAMRGHSRVMWEGKMWGGTDQRIIGYGDFSYQRTGKERVEWFIVGLARQKGHMSTYVNAAGEDGYLIHEYADRLGKVKLGSAVISFKSVEDIDVDVLVELVGRARELMT